MALVRLRSNSYATIIHQLLLVVRQISHEKKQATATLQLDAIDTFTTKLIKKKSIKWGNFKLKEGVLNKELLENECKAPNRKKDAEKLSIDQINEMFHNYMENSNDRAALKLMRQCIKNNDVPKHSVLFYVINLAAAIGDKEMIRGLQKLYAGNKSLMETNSNFEAFMAQAIWVRGNIIKALDIFRDLYRNNVYIRRRVKIIFKYLVGNVVQQHSGAALLNIIKFSENILKDSNDVYFLVQVWHACFMSEWYADQCTAVELLEKHAILCNQIIHHIPLVVNNALRNHKTDIVQRLLEILLKYNLQIHIPNVIIPLFHYQVKKGDLRSCNEIIEWSIKNNIDVPFINKERRSKPKREDIELKF